MPSVENILTQGQSWVTLRERQVRETRRTVFLVDERYIVKQFEIPLHVSSYRKPWLCEDQGLKRLDGTHAPRSFGFVESVGNNTRIIQLVKEYIPGHPCQNFAMSDMQAVAELMAGVHKKLVITDDANVQNFMKMNDGRMIFVDFGRAQVFSWQSPWFLVRIGGELAKLRREGFYWDNSLWSAFLPAYFNQLDCSHTARWVIRCACAIKTITRMIRKSFNKKSHRS